MSTEDRKERETLDLTDGSILKLLILYTIPLLLGNLFQQFYNLADLIIAGRFIGKAALAAVGSTSALINTVIGLFLGISVGAGVIISQRFGAKDDEGLSKAIHTTVAIAAVLGICFTILGTIFSPILLRMISTPKDVFATALTYLRIYFFGISGLVIYNMASGILRAIGETKRPTYALIVSSISNVILDLLFVVVLKMGVAGTALATVIAQFSSAAYLIVYLCRTHGSSGLYVNKIKIHSQFAIDILHVGVPIGLQRTITAFSNTIVQSHVNEFGSDYMAGWAVYNKVHQLAILPMDNIGTATVTFVGQNYGAMNIPRVKLGVKTAMMLNFIVISILSGMQFIFASNLAQMFSMDDHVVEAGTMFLRLLAMLIPISTVNRIYAGALRGMGDGKSPMIIMLMGNVLARQIYLSILPERYYTIQTVAISYPIGWTVASILMYIYYRMVIQKKLKEKYDN